MKEVVPTHSAEREKLKPGKNAISSDVTRTVTLQHN